MLWHLVSIAVQRLQTCLFTRKSWTLSYTLSGNALVCGFNCVIDFVISVHRLQDLKEEPTHPLLSVRGDIIGYNVVMDLIAFQRKSTWGFFNIAADSADNCCGLTVSDHLATIHHGINALEH